MICRKILPRPLIYLLSFFSFLGVSLLFGHSTAFATSQSFSYSSAEHNYPTAYYEFNAANVGFDFTYVSVDAHTSTLNNRSTRCYSVSNGSVGVDSGLVYVQYNAFSLSYTNSYFMLANPCSSDSMTLTFYDYNPLVPQDCPDCPPVPETQYGDILDKIYHAIILVPAMAFVLYLFFIFYSWYCGGHR